jgi:hypothetical protein
MELHGEAPRKLCWSWLRGASQSLNSFNDEAPMKKLRRRANPEWLSLNHLAVSELDLSQTKPHTTAFTEYIETTSPFLSSAPPVKSMYTPLKHPGYFYSHVRSTVSTWVCTLPLHLEAHFYKLLQVGAWCGNLLFGIQTTSNRLF